MLENNTIMQETNRLNYLHVKPVHFTRGKRKRPVHWLRLQGYIVTRIR